MKSHKKKKTGIQVAELSKMSSGSSSSEEQSGSPAELSPAVADKRSEEKKVESEVPTVCAGSDSSSSESSSDSEADEGDVSKVPVVVDYSKGSKVEEEKDTEAEVSEESKDLKSDEEIRTEVEEDIRTEVDVPEEPKVSRAVEENRTEEPEPVVEAPDAVEAPAVGSEEPKEMVVEDVPSKKSSADGTKSKKRKSFNIMVIQQESKPESRKEVKLSKEKTPKKELQSAGKASTEHHEAKKDKSSTASTAVQPSPIQKPTSKKNPSDTAKDVKSKSLKRKKTDSTEGNDVKVSKESVDNTCDAIRNMEAEEKKNDDSGDNTGITDIKEAASCVSSKKTSSTSHKKKKKTGDETEGTKVTRARSAYIFFSMEERSRVKLEYNLDNKDVMKKLGEEWNALSAEGKKKYEDMAEVDKKRSADEREQKPEKTEEAPKSEKVSKSKASTTKEKKKDRTSKPRREPRSLPTAKANVPANFDGFDDENDPEAPTSRTAIKCDDDTAWMTAEELDASGDLEFVVGKSLKGEYITKRKGMDYTQVEYEEAPSEKIGSKPDEVKSEDLADAIRRYEVRRSAFKKDLKLRTANGKLDLDDLRSGSPLEMLAFLGIMREDVFLPSSTRLPPPDVWMKVPMLGLCHLMQTLLDGERASKATLIKRSAACQQRLQNLQAKRSSQE